MIRAFHFFKSIIFQIFSNPLLCIGPGTINIKWDLRCPRMQDWHRTIRDANTVHTSLMLESNCLSSMKGIREVLVALSTQLISNADKVTSADTQGTFFKTTIYVNSSIWNAFKQQATLTPYGCTKCTRWFQMNVYDFLKFSDKYGLPIKLTVNQYQA